MRRPENHLHTLLERQLKRLNLIDKMPANMEEWNKFLKHISDAYENTDQERYLLERSMEISSKEMMDLNKQLEDAQHIAHLGYWYYDKKDDKLYWSKETSSLFEVSPDESAPTLEKLLQMVNAEDRPRLTAAIHTALTEGIPYDIELRIKTKTGKLRWHHAKGQAHLPGPEDADQSIRYLSGIEMDITDRKLADEQMKKLHHQLLESARQAGMAEIAISVLHNIGNILNSACVSAKIIQESTQENYLMKLKTVAEIIKEHNVVNDTFLLTDEKGKLIADYLINIAKELQTENNKIIIESQHLDAYLQHIKDIVLLQKDMSGISGVVEKIFLPEIIELCINMALTSNKNKLITVIKHINDPIFLELDRAKLIQILVNLIRNAKDSVLLSKNKDKKIILSLKKDLEKNVLQIIVSDTGVGIEKENMTKIFSLGFTTKKEGHGFGLHSSAIAARDLAGDLKVISDGVEKGATFILVLPLETQLKTKGVNKNATV